MPSSAERDRTNGQRGREARQLHTHGETESERRARRGGGGSGEDGVAVDDDGSYKSSCKQHDLTHPGPPPGRRRTCSRCCGSRTSRRRRATAASWSAPPWPSTPPRARDDSHAGGAACRGGRPHRKPFAGSALNMKQCCDRVTPSAWKHPPFGALPAHDPVSRIRCRKACSDHMALQ